MILISCVPVLEIGANLPKARRVIVAGPPSLLHEVVQYMGRVGRREEGGVRRGVCILLWNNTDLARPEISEPVRAFCRSQKCLKSEIAEYFGTKYTSSSDWCCSVCLGFKSKEGGEVNGEDEERGDEDSSDE